MQTAGKSDRGREVLQYLKQWIESESKRPVLAVWTGVR
jgi:hypothetical protein